MTRVRQIERDVVSPLTEPWPSLRPATQDDEDEFVRLFRLWAAETGVDDYSVEKVWAMFSRAIRRDRAGLVVLLAFVDPEHRDSVAGRELLGFSRQTKPRQEAALDLIMVR
jgi:hypothetical protein